MEIKIENKKNNLLLNRTEVHFTVTHDGESTPNRDIIRNELADNLNAKKENIVINYMKSGFGKKETKGYAKVYTSLEQLKGLEQKHFLIRNKIISKDEKKKGEKKEGASDDSQKETKKPAEPKKEDAPSESKTNEEEKVEQKVDEEKKPALDNKEPEKNNDKKEIIDEDKKE